MLVFDAKDLYEDISATFSRLQVPDQYDWGYHIDGKAPDTISTRRNRERRRKAKMEADPQYAERRRAQARETQRKKREQERAERINEELDQWRARLSLLQSDQRT